MNGKEWKPMHTAILQAMHATHHDHEIAAKTGHTRETVCRRRLALGLPGYYATRYADWPDLPAMSQKAIRRACAA